MNSAIRVILLMCLVITGARASEGASQKSVYVVTYVDVVAIAVPQATALLKAYQTATRRETGALSVELYGQQCRSGSFALLESWRSDAAFKAHSKGIAVRQLTNALQPIQVGPWDVRPHTAYSFGENLSQRDHSITLLVHVDVPPPFLANYEKILQPYVTTARQDRGLERLDVLQGAEPRINHFTVIERWDDDAAIEAHQRAAHTQTYRSGLAPILGALYDERAYQKVE